MYDIGNLYARVDFSPYGIFFVAGWRYIQWRGFVIVASVRAWLVFALEVALRRADRDRRPMFGRKPRWENADPVTGW